MFLTYLSIGLLMSVSYSGLVWLPQTFPADALPDAVALLCIASVCW